MSHSRMMAEHFGISILESDAKLLHERIQLLITEAYNRGVQHERDEIKNAVGLMPIDISELPTVTKVMSIIHARSNP
jgi:hypothetical protein